MATVKITGLNKTQANLILILFEDGVLPDFLNEKIKEKFKDSVDEFDVPACYPDEDSFSPSHEISFE